MPVDVDGDVDGAGLAGDALHGRADTGPPFAHDVDHDVDMMVGRLMVTSACAT